MRASSSWASQSRRRWRQGEPTQNPSHEVTQSQPELHFGIPGALLAGWAGLAGCRGLEGRGRELQGSGGHGPLECKLWGLLFLLTRAVYNAIHKAGQPGPGPISVCLRVGRGRPMVTKQRTRCQIPKGKQARVPERGLRTRAFGMFQRTGINRLGLEAETMRTFLQCTPDFPDTLTARASP